jgi:hypothetical protein
MPQFSYLFSKTLTVYFTKIIDRIHFKVEFASLHSLYAFTSLLIQRVKYTVKTALFVVLCSSRLLIIAMVNGKISHGRRQRSRKNGTTLTAAPGSGP